MGYIQQYNKLIKDDTEALRDASPFDSASGNFSENFNRVDVNTTIWTETNVDGGADNVLDCTGLLTRQCLRLNPKTTDTDVCGVVLTNRGYSKDDGAITIQFDMRRDDAGTNYCYAGLSVGTAYSYGTDFIGVLYLEQAGADDIFAECCKSTTATHTSIEGSPVATTWYTIKIEINSTWTSVKTYIDGTLKDTCTTNIPDDVFLFFHAFTRRATVDAEFYIDNLTIDVVGT